MECPRCKRVDWAIPRSDPGKSVVPLAAKKLGPEKILEKSEEKANFLGCEEATKSINPDTAVIGNPSGGWLFLRRSGGKVTLIDGFPVSAYVDGPYETEELAWQAGLEIVSGEK